MQDKTNELSFSKPCRSCSDENNTIDMHLRFITKKEAIYVCDQCYEVDPPNGKLTTIDVDDKPLVESDMERLNLPVELLSHFPKLRMDFAEKVMRVINYRERQYVDELWSETMNLNDKLSLHRAVKKVDIVIDDNFVEPYNSDFLYDISDIKKEELADIEKVLDCIEGYYYKSCKNSELREDSETSVEKKDDNSVESCGSNVSAINKEGEKGLDCIDADCKSCRKNDLRKDSETEVSNLNIEDFFKMYEQQLIARAPRKGRPRKVRQYAPQRYDVNARYHHLVKLHQQTLFKSFRQKLALLERDHPLYNIFAKHRKSTRSVKHTKPSFTKEYFFKVLESSNM